MKKPRRSRSSLARRLTIEPLETRRVLTEVLVTPVAGSVVNESGGSADYAVVLTSAPTDDVTVSLSLSDEGEASLSSSTVIFTPDNWDVSQTVTVTGDADNQVDADVTFDLMATASSADPVYDGVSAVDVSVTNENRDTATITIAAAQVVEDSTLSNGFVQGGTLRFVVTLDTAIEGGVRVGASTRDLTAAGGEDYQNTIRRLSFSGNAGETENFDVLAINDSLVEGSETFEAVLSIIEGLSAGIDPADVTFDQSTAVGTILENEFADIGFTATTPTFDEQAGTQTLTVTLLTTPGAELGGPVSIRITDLGTGTADPTSDFTFATQTVVFAAGSRSLDTQSFTIQIAEDQVLEPNETINLGLEIIGDDLNGAVTTSQQAEATITITGDQQNGEITGTVRIDSNNDGVVQEGERPIAGVTVQLTGTDSQGQAISLERMTDAEGVYRFEDLPAGEYRLTQVQPANYVSGSEVLGTVDGTADGLAAPNQFEQITLGVGAIAEGYDFSELGLAAGFVDIRSFLATNLAAATAPAPIAAAAVAALGAETEESTAEAAPAAIALAVAPQAAVEPSIETAPIDEPSEPRDLAFASYAMLQGDDEEDESSFI